MTPDRAALREIAERRAKDLESHKDCPLVDGEDIGDETCDLALQYHFARAYLDATAPLLVTCRECSELSYAEMLARGLPAVPCLDDHASPDTILEIARSVYRKTICTCHGTGSVERADLAAIRKRFEAPGGPENVSAECRSLCGDIPFLLDLIAAQAREIAELKGKANGTL